MKILFSYNNDSKDQFELKSPDVISTLDTESVDEIEARSVIEKISDHVKFIDECYRILKPQAKVTFVSPYYATTAAWASPLTRRALSETSLNFINKKWREDNKIAEVSSISNFDIAIGVATDDQYWKTRPEEHRAFAMLRWNNVLQAIHFICTKI